MLWCQAGKTPQLPPPVVGFDVSDLNTLLDAIKREAGVHILPLPDARLTSIIGVLFAVLVALGAYLGQSARLWQAEGREGGVPEGETPEVEGGQTTPWSGRDGSEAREGGREGGRSLTGKGCASMSVCLCGCLCLISDRAYRVAPVGAPQPAALAGGVAVRVRFWRGRHGVLHHPLPAALHLQPRETGPALRHAHVSQAGSQSDRPTGRQAG